MIVGFSRFARADSHGISGCITILDDREFGDENSTTHGEYVPLVDAVLQISIIDLLGFDTYVGDLTTNAAGCFSGTVSGIGVPEDTTITVQMRLENDDVRVTDDVGTWLYEIGSKSVSVGKSADWGTVYGASGNGAAMQWVNAHDATSLHDDRFGAGAWASRSYPLLTILFPLLDSDVSNATESRLAITRSSRDNMNLFLHELGHWVGMNDAASSGSLGSYCQSYVGSAWPYTETPYIYTDPDMSSSDCGWTASAWETEQRVLSESHANFIRDVLWRGECSSSSESWDLNFDGAHSVYNVGRAICDVIDSGTEKVGALHSYGDPGHITVAKASVNLSPAGHLKGGIAIGTDEAKIYSVDYTTGAMTSVYDTFDSGVTPELVSSDGSSLCFTNSSYAYLYCGPTSGSGPLFKQTLPTGMSSVKDIIVDGNHAYVTGRVISDNKVYRADLKTAVVSGKMGTVILPHVVLENWEELYSESYVDESSVPRHIAVNASETTLYLAREHWVEACSLSGMGSVRSAPFAKKTSFSGSSACSAGKTADFAGSRLYAGYSRGAPTTSYLRDITQIEVHGGKIYIADSYGVARMDLGSPTTLEQYIGPGADIIFLNGLSRRSLYMTSDVNAFFAMSGKQVLYQPSSVNGWDEQRDVTRAPLSMYLIDDDKTVHEEYYCGEENVQKNARDVVHAFSGNAYGVSLSDFLRKNLSLATGEASAVENVSWTDLKSCQGADFAGTEIDEDLVTGTPVSSSSSSSNTKTYFADDVPCGEADPDAQLPPEGRDRAETPYESHAPDGSEKRSVPESFDTPTPMIVN
jgi:hypothetical protein